MKRIKEFMDISNNRIGNLIVDLSNEMEGFERRCEAKMEKLQAQIEEFKQQIFQNKRSRGQVKYQQSSSFLSPLLQVHPNNESTPFL